MVQEEFGAADNVGVTFGELVARGTSGHAQNRAIESLADWCVGVRHRDYAVNVGLPRQPLQEVT